MEGQGTYFYENGDKFVGQFLKDSRHGPGQMIYREDGLTYEGNFVRDSLPKTARIISTKENTVLYEGSISDEGLRNGLGTEFARNGDRYVGQFSNDQRNASGKLFGSDNFQKYSGQWKNGKKNG
jgi:hypothetical protein